MGAGLKRAKEAAKITRWRRGDIAVYQGGIAGDDLTVGSTYVTNAVGTAHGAIYLQIITDDREVRDLLATHFVCNNRLR